MSIKISYTHKHSGVMMKSGEFYTFHYQPYANDPNPNIIFINYISGIHPKSSHQWRLIQAINLSYIPRKDRKKFVEDWEKNKKKSKGNLKFTWDLVKRKYPYLKFSIRRYQTKPNYYISKVEALDTDKKIAAGLKFNWAKDFSNIIRRKIASKLKKFF